MLTKKIRAARKFPCLTRKSHVFIYLFIYLFISWSSEWLIAFASDLMIGSGLFVSPVCSFVCVFVYLFVCLNHCFDAFNRLLISFSFLQVTMVKT